MDTFKARSARLGIFSEGQIGIIIGSILGDGYLVKTTRGFALRVNHGIKQKSYVDWKFNQLEGFVNSPPRVYQNSYYFRTVSHNKMSELRGIFYDKNRKIIPLGLDGLLSPVALATWIMDDGSFDDGGLRINTQSFTKQENQELQRILMAKFGIESRLNRDRNYWRLRIMASSVPLVWKLVSPFIIPSMRYKFSL
jgi:hypothetical protein